MSRLRGTEAGSSVSLSLSLSLSLSRGDVILVAEPKRGGHGEIV